MQSKKNSKLSKSLKDLRTYFFGALVLLSVILLIQLFMVQVVPMKFLIPLILVLALCIGLLWFLQYGKKVSKLNKILGKVLIVIISALLVVGNLYLFKATSTLDKITGEGIETNAISVIVLKDSKATELDDLKNEMFGYNNEADKENTIATVEDINKKLDSSVKTTTYIDYNSLAKSLYDKESGAIIMNEAYRGLLEEKYPNFDSETKVIYQHEIEVKVENIGKAVNVTTESFNIMISGIDTYGPVNTRSRSDVNMIATVNPTTKTIVLTSIPRDFYLPQVCQGGQKDKLTHTGIFGVDCTIKTVEQEFGIDINYYARVNFTSLINIVDALGGITVNSPFSFTASSGDVFTAGDVYLDGARALAFSRERYSFADGDRERGRNQMRVLTGIISKATSPAIITNYNSVMNAVGGSFQTNMESSDITALIKMQLNNMSGWNIVQQSVTGEGSSLYSPANGFNSYMMVPDESSVTTAKATINSAFNAK